MIGFLRGNLLHFEDNRGILDVRDVGYEIFAPVRALAEWSAADDTIEVWVSTQVREDAIALYAFPTQLDKQAFDVLLGVSGVGPKIGLAALDTYDVATLTKAVEGDEVATLQRISGVGKRTAQRLALELKGKLPASFTPDTAGAQVQQRQRANADANNLELALARLGYTATEIKKVHGKLEERGLAPDAPLSDRLRVAVQILYGNG